MRNELVLACMAISLCLAGCGTYFAPDRNVKRRLSNSDVIGTWRMTPKSHSLLMEDGFTRQRSYPYVITFRPDETLAFASMTQRGPRQEKYINASGTWGLEHDTTGDSNVWKKNTLRLNIKIDDMTYEWNLNFTEENGDLVLWTFYGDPDLWEFVEYKRAP